MDLVHTAIHSKLAVDKVHKTTIIGMDIKQSHLEAGLVHSWGHQNFKAPTSTDQLQETNTNNFDTGDFEDILDFEQIIEDAAAEINSDSDIEDDELLPPTLPLTIWLSLHAIQSTH